jgi:S-DNA-T family DNA segregation ATPase FtsK/SpoIIIE
MIKMKNYEFPPIELMKKSSSKTKNNNKTLVEMAVKIEKTLYSFGVSAKVENYSVSPTIIKFELKLAEGVRVSKITKLTNDIALNLGTETIRIEAPIPGKQVVGIEIPNPEREIVPLRDVLESNEFKEAKSKLSFGLGKDLSGKPVIANIEEMPHVLIAGSTGSGKSVCINSLITSILYKANPNEVKFLMIDPKEVELSVYNGIPHLLIPVVTDAKKSIGALAWIVEEMENRYQLFAKKGTRDLKSYNNISTQKLPQIVIIIDELADLMMASPKDIEEYVCRLVQKARASGIHLVIATQRPSVDVITGLIKANIPSRIAFTVSSQIDSRTILDIGGAEKLLGKGDMLYYPIGTSKPQRVQGTYITNEEIKNVVDFIKEA